MKWCKKRYSRHINLNEIKCRHFILIEMIGQGNVLEMRWLLIGFFLLDILHRVKTHNIIESFFFFNILFVCLYMHKYIYVYGCLCVCEFFFLMCALGQVVRECWPREETSRPNIDEFEPSVCITNPTLQSLFSSLIYFFCSFFFVIFFSFCLNICTLNLKRLRQKNKECSTQKLIHQTKNSTGGGSGKVNFTLSGGRAMFMMWKYQLNRFHCFLSSKERQLFGGEKKLEPKNHKIFFGIDVSDRERILIHVCYPHH